MAVRWRPALALACLLAGLATAAAVPRLADDGVPDHLVLPARVTGDRGVYRVDTVRPEGSTSSEHLFEVQDAEAAYRPDGTPFATEPIYEEWTQVNERGTSMVWWRRTLDDDAGPVLTERMVGWSRWSGLHCTGACVTVSVLGSGLYAIESERAITDASDVALCGLRNGLQGSASSSLAHPVAFHGACGTDRLDAVARRTLGGRPAVVFADRDDPDRLQVWLVAGLAYPAFVWEDLGNGTSRSHMLTGFSTGAPGVDAPLPPPLPAAALAPRTQVGPALGGFAMDFGLTDALQRARDDPAGSTVAGALDAGAQVAAATYSEVSNGHWRERAWDVHLVGPQARSFRILLGELEEGEPPGTQLLYSTDPDAATEGEFVVETIPPLDRLAPVGMLPAELPTVASAAARWERLRPDDVAQAANAWEFAIRCADETCTSVESWVSAGHDRLSSDQSSTTDVDFLGVVTEPVVRAVVLMAAVDPQGRTVFLDETHQVRGPRGLDFAPRPVPSEAPAPATTALGWDRPAPWIAAGASIAALVAALALLANALRHGGLALFSRIAPTRLADHPVRAGLLAAVAAEPGIHVAELARRLDLAAGATQHHLGKLTAGGLVRSVPHGDRTLYFPAQTSARLLGVLPALRNEGAAAIVRMVRERPGISVSDLASAVGRTPGTVSHHLDRLQEAGLLERRRDGRKVGIHPTALASDPVVAAAVDF